MTNTFHRLPVPRCRYRSAFDEAEKQIHQLTDIDDWENYPPVPPLRPSGASYIYYTRNRANNGISIYDTCILRIGARGCKSIHYGRHYKPTIRPFSISRTLSTMRVDTVFRYEDEEGPCSRRYLSRTLRSLLPPAPELRPSICISIRGPGV